MSFDIILIPAKMYELDDSTECIFRRSNNVPRNIEITGNIRLHTLISKSLHGAIAALSSLATSKPTRYIGCVTAILFCSAALAITPPDALALQGSYRSIKENLLQSNLLRPLQITSQESAAHLSGDLFATVEYDMTLINVAASSTERWCEVMLLLSNSHGCHVTPSNNNDILEVSISSSKTADMTGATPTTFQLQVRSTTADYLDAALVAIEGPMGTRNISLRLQAIPLTATRSFVHLHYAYDTQWLGRMAMQAYLQTAGRGKVGFTPTADVSSSSPYISGARGVIERNTMRYFLGFDCALAFNAQKSLQRFSSMAQCWYGQVEQYPVQLHEMQRTEYLNMKAAQYQREQKNP